MSTIGAGAARTPLLVVLGADRPKVKVTGGHHLSGGTDLYRLLGDQPFEQLNLSRNFLKRSGRPDLTRHSTILNIVTDPDQNPEVLETLRKLLRGYRGRVINRPEAVLRSGRDQVARLLADAPGLHVPKTLRLPGGKPALAAAAVERAGMRFPLIVRLAGAHMGKIVGLVRDLESLAEAVSGQGDHIATEFIDFQGDDGLYRKYRVYFFGQSPILRHMIASDQWNVHVSERGRFMVGRRDLMEEELRLMARPEGDLPDPVHSALGEVRSRMPLDFFGIDFGIAPDGQPILFEANATMSFFPLVADPRFAYLQRCLLPAQQAFRALVKGDPE